MAIIYKFPKTVIRCASPSEIDLNLSLLRNGMIRGLTVVKVDGVWTMTVYSHLEIIDDDMEQAIANMRKEYCQ